MTIHSPTQQADVKRLPMIALASALLVVGFAVGQVAPNLAAMIGTAIDSAQTEAVTAPALTRADDFATRHSGTAPALTRGDDYATRHSGGAPELTRGDDYATRHASP